MGKFWKNVGYFLFQDLVSMLRNKMLSQIICVQKQCDQIGQFIGLWASFLKPLAAINLPKYPTCLGNFCKGVIFLVKSIWCNFYRHLAIFFWSHCSPLQQMFKINGIISDPFRPNASHRVIFPITRWSNLLLLLDRTHCESTFQESVWPDAEIKSSPNFSKSCIKISHSWIY